MLGQHQQEIVAGSALRRIILVLAVAALMAMMVAAMAAPAFAAADTKASQQGEAVSTAPPGAVGPETADFCSSLAERGKCGKVFFSEAGKNNNGHG